MPQGHFFMPERVYFYPNQNPLNEETLRFPFKIIGTI